MDNKKLTDNEFEKLIQKLMFFDTTRNSLLTFSFTSVLAVLGIAIGTDAKDVTPWICLVPFLLIIPFSARISYYRLASAHITAFLKVFSPERMSFEHGTEYVPEDTGSCLYSRISWLLNHEMFFLGLATDFTFYFKYVPQVTSWTLVSCLEVAIPILCTLIVFLIADSTYRYSIISEKFRAEWVSYQVHL